MELKAKARRHRKEWDTDEHGFGPSVRIAQFRYELRVESFGPSH